jgi:ParB-like chromosome segregation protein Spo0J
MYAMTATSATRDEHDDRRSVPVNMLRPGPSPRQGIDLSQVAALAELDGAWEPIVVRRTSMEVLDGRHRLAAAKRLGHTSVRVTYFDGSDAEARVEAVRLNVRHGLPLSLTERTAAARELLELLPEWSDRQLGTTCGLSPRTVARLRSPAAATDPDAECIPLERGRRIGKDGRRYPTDPNAQREAIRVILEEDRHASLRSVAARTGASPETVRSVRMSLVADEAEAAAPPIVVPLAVEEHAAWTEDTACVATEEGLDFAQWFDEHHLDAQQLLALAEAVPIGRAYGVIDEARRRMALWDQFAQSVQHRIHARTPSGRAADRWGTQVVIGAHW